MSTDLKNIDDYLDYLIYLDEIEKEVHMWTSEDKSNRATHFSAELQKPYIPLASEVKDKKD